MKISQNWRLIEFAKVSHTISFKSSILMHINALMQSEKFQTNKNKKNLLKPSQKENKQI